ncbi:MAG: HPr family phosphocarrier protein [Lachnospiraceae bacterium]|jgi:phosphotransferase system HPr (HPr) family protein
MLVKDIKICINDNIVDRPIAKFVQVAGKFESKIQIITEQGKVNAKSIMGMMNFGFEAGKEVRIQAEGSDEQEAVSSLEKFLACGEQ